MNDKSKSNSAAITFGDFKFQPETGELFGLEDEAPRTRLPPQPAKLLSLLIEREGEIVPRELICREIWDESNVDLDQRLHFCVRQIRSALGDSASNPKYVETIPRRGYRWLVRCQPAATSGSLEDSDVSAPYPVRKFDKTQKQIVIGIAVLSFMLLAWIGIQLGRQSGAQTAQKTPRIRIAVMPFEAKPETGWPPETRQIGEMLVLRLFDEGPAESEIIGPSTTEAFDDSAKSLKSLIAEYSIDFVINGRFIQRNGQAGLLAELIRAEDGAHIWVQLFETSDEVDSIVQEIIDGVAQEFASSPRPVS